MDKFNQYEKETQNCHIARRRAIIAHYMEIGKSDYFTITEALLKEDIFDKNNDLPYSQKIIISDKKWIRERWKQECSESYETLVSDVVAKTNKIYQLALEAREYGTSLSSLKSLREILDLDKPKGSRAIKAASDEMNDGLTESQAAAQAVKLDSSPAVLGEMLKIMRDVGALDAALVTETESEKIAKSVDEHYDSSFPATNETNSHAMNGNGTH